MDVQKTCVGSRRCTGVISRRSLLTRLDQRDLLYQQAVVCFVCVLRRFSVRPCVATRRGRLSNVATVAVVTSLDIKKKTSHLSISNVAVVTSRGETGATTVEKGRFFARPLLGFKQGRC